MRELTSRDRNIYNFIEAYESITIDQCSKIFMTDKKRRYEIACRRLNRLLELDYIKVGTIKYSHQNVYYIDKKLSYHDLMVIQYCAEIMALGATEIRLERNKNWNSDFISDGFVYFKINGKSYISIIEVCLSNRKVHLDKYDDLYTSNVIQDAYGVEPSLVIISEFHEKYPTDYIPVHVFDFTFNNLIQIMA